jgi:putative phage-type endonuclease
MDLFAPDNFKGAKLLGVFQNGTDAWHEARTHGIGGSEIGTLLGLNQWASAYALFCKRLELIPNPPLTSMAVKIGNALEQPILDLWADIHPEYEVFTTGTYQHAKIPYLHANPDALAKHKETGEWVVIEVKTSRNYWPELPPAYEAQVQHYLDVLHLKRGILVALVGMDWTEYEIDRDDFRIENQRIAASEFWRCLETATPPAWDGSQSTFEAVREQHPDITDEEVEIADGHLLPLAQRAFDEAEANLLRQKSEVMFLMGSAKHAYIEVDGKPVRIASRQARGHGKPFLVVRK